MDYGSTISLNPFMTFFLFLLAVAEGTSIYVKHLPGNATIDMLENEFKKFGAIGNGGVQVISQKVRLTDKLTIQNRKFESLCPGMKKH